VPLLLLLRQGNVGWRLKTGKKSFFVEGRNFSELKVSLCRSFQPKTFSRTWSWSRLSTRSHRKKSFKLKSAVEAAAAAAAADKVQNCQ
jgi:hypothetical protein